MNLFKRPKTLYRVVPAFGGFVPQVYDVHRKEWMGISKDGEEWSSVERQRKYCVMEVEETAQTIMDSYRAITE